LKFLDLKQLPNLTSINILVKLDFLKKVLIFLRKIFDVEIVYYASSLSFYTILSIIPLTILLFSIFTRLPSFDGFYIEIQNSIFDYILPSHKEIIQKYIDMFISNSNHIEVVGIFYIIFTSIMFFQNYEYIINRMLFSKKRGFWQSLTLYWTMITLLPIVLFLSIFLSIKFYHILENSGYMWNIISINTVPYPFLVIWFLFFISYRISITIKVRNRIILLSSFITAISWEWAKTGFVYYVLYNTTYLSIYGSFSILMFFFIWIYLSWIIFLYGFKVIYILK